MRILAAAILFISGPAFACETPICVVDPDALELTQTITFDDLPSGWDPGHKVDDLLVLDGARFAERFAGQDVKPAGNFDQISGPALGPLTLLPGAPGQSLSVAVLNATNVLNGFGPAGYPRPQAQGEGAIAVLFEDDQPVLALDILGGEAGFAFLSFLRRNGTVIHSITLPTRGTMKLGFHRQGFDQDIAGFVLTNRDPEGLAIDNLRFGPPVPMG